MKNLFLSFILFLLILVPFESFSKGHESHDDHSELHSADPPDFSWVKALASSEKNPLTRGPEPPPHPTPT